MTPEPTDYFARSKFYLYASAAFFMLLPVAAPVAAQETAPDNSAAIQKDAAQKDKAQPKPPVSAPTGDVSGDIVVTARRITEKIIDVPVSVSAFSAERLSDLKIEGGSELLRAIPNVSFSKDNFTGYNFSIRGIGTKAISVTTDPAVAISFNNTTLLRNRLFEQEYFDVQRVEVLRGPQGTLYGRNATAGVVNMLPNLPKLEDLSGDLQIEGGNFNTRRARGYVNLPVGDTLALRFAGAYTKRDGFDYNTFTEKRVNGRDLYSIRGSLLWEPTSRFKAHAIWERFREDDNRSRTGKQLCTRGEAPSHINWTDPDGNQRSNAVHTRWTTALLSSGCQNKSLYTDDAYGIPNGRGFPVVIGLILATPFNDRNAPGNGYDGNYIMPTDIDPFAVKGNRQSANLREIATFYDPKFKAENDVFQLNLEYDIPGQVTFYSQSLYMEDSYYGSQDFFRFSPDPGLMYSRAQIGKISGKPRVVNAAWDAYLGVSPAGHGTFKDPQLGELDRLAAVDISQSKSNQFSQEIRMTSSFDGPFNFNLGANYLRFKTEENYYVFSNAFTIIAIAQNGAAAWNAECNKYLGFSKPDPNACIHIDPNPIDSLDNKGHNYYRKLSPSKIESWSAFGEAYMKLTDTVRMTMGLRFTDDTKITTPVPSQLLASSHVLSGAKVGKGYPQDPDVTQKWAAITGRFSVDWKPDISFTDDSLIYASYSRGYKAGGVNPVGADANPAISNYPLLGDKFAPEYVNAFEVGIKNSAANGKLMFNATGFFYDYKGYQISQLIDRMNHTENFNANIYGVEFETAWAPTRNFRLDATLGLLKTRLADGESSLDVMDRLQGRTDYTLLHSWPTSPANCVVPNEVLGRFMSIYDQREGIGSAFISMLCPGPLSFGGGFLPGSLISTFTKDKWGSLLYDPVKDGPNQGRGFSADLSGHSLPNAPKLTFNVGAQQRFALWTGWDLTVRGDFYHQSSSFARVYNSDYDRLKGWSNANMAMTLSGRDAGVSLQLYVKNIFNHTPLTDAYTGPDELGNFTNVFTLDPRIIGLSAKKKF
ncbi:TonB-dependent receptor [Pseudonocardia sp. TMWB2A]|uniref:TonB-dependent receptor n=1 Tax=Pseudonocardia sp. TMWB2A TaxID=687430 RepID=UPI00307F4563